MGALADKHQKEFNQLRKHSRLIKLCGFLAVLALIAYPALHSPGPEFDTLAATRGKLIASNFPLSAELIENYGIYSSWINRNAGYVETLTFDILSRNILCLSSSPLWSRWWAEFHGTLCGEFLFRPASHGLFSGGFCSFMLLAFLLRDSLERTGTPYIRKATTCWESLAITACFSLA